MYSVEIFIILIFFVHELEAIWQITRGVGLETTSVESLSGLSELKDKDKGKRIKVESVELISVGC